MTVYIEYVLIENFVIDFLLLSTTFKIQKKKSNILRLTISSLLASVISLVFPLIEVHTIILTLIKIFSGALILLLSNTFNTVKDYYISLVLFLFLTFFTGGVIMGVFSILGLNYSSKIAIIIMVMPAYIVIKCIREIVKYLYRKKDYINKIIDVELSFGGNKIIVKAFMDTGNELYFNGKPVVVLNKRVALKLIKEKMPKLNFINCQTVNGKSKMLVFLLDKISFEICKSKREFLDVYVGISRSGLGSYDLILHPAFFGEDYGKVVSDTTKEVVE